MKRIDVPQLAETANAALPVPQAEIRLAVIIPAYRPTARLIDLLEALSRESIPAIVLVDDGSGREYSEIFARASEFPKVRLLRHAVNLGKGAALKTGINYAMCAFPDLQAVVTADADGQHDPEDIRRVADEIAAHPDRVVLGARTFGSGVPLRSKAGNLITRAVMRAMTGQHLTDTQTGLRAIPVSLLPALLRLETNGYDFELDMLVTIERKAVLISEVPIRTIYDRDHSTSHFNPLRDSMKIYFVLLRFASVSLMTAALDMLVFYLAYKRLGNLAKSQVMGRILAVIFNYLMVRRTVFFSQSRHLSVLPKYLLLVCASGCASYAGIRLLDSSLHTGVVFAKILVESLLFFANFAIQRDFIFGKSGAPPRTKVARRRFSPSMDHVLAAAAIGLLAICLFGFFANKMWMHPGWSPVGWLRLMRYTGIFAAVSLPLMWFRPSAFAPIAAALFILATAVALGPLALSAVVLFLLSAWALGSTLLRRDSDLCAVLLGMAVFIFLMTFLVRLPVNYPGVYFALLAIPIAINARAVGKRLAFWVRALMQIRRPRVQAAAFALLVYVVGMHWLIIPQPESSADGLAMHLAIPVNISVHHVMTYTPDRILWSVMPMGADYCYTMVYLLGGEFAARLLNFVMLLLVVTLLYRIARGFVDPAVAFVILALFASTSLVELVTGSLFIENFLAVMVAGLAAALIEFADTREKGFLYLAAVLAGTALAMKFGGLAYICVALVVAVFEVRRHWPDLGPRPALACLGALALFLAAALPTYVISWRLTGDPVFPFFNRIFPSRIIDNSVNFVDYRFNQPLTSHTLYDLTFHTDRYFEGNPGSIGFSYWLLAPLGFVALAAVRKPPALIAAAVSLGGGLFVLKFLPNVRYLYPALPLALVPVAALFGWLPPGCLRRASIWLALACVAANICFLSASNAYHNDFYEQAPLARASRQAYIHNNASMREIGEYMNRTHPGAPVFLAAGNDLAAFNAEAYATGWHQFGVFMRLHNARSPQEVDSILKGWNVHYIAAPKPGVAVINPRPLQDLIAQCTTPEYESKYFYLARIEDGCRPAKRMPLLVPPGLYDDFDPAIVFDGPWVQDQGWPQAHAHTLTYTDSPGATIRFAYDGGLLSFIYTKAMNRGMADVFIDGVDRGTVDLYSPQTTWESRSLYKLSRGRHLAVVTVLPDKNPKSSGRFVDLDSFMVQ